MELLLYHDPVFGLRHAEHDSYIFWQVSPYGEDQLQVEFYILSTEVFSRDFV